LETKDIHRMAPIEEAGQPIVIGGVVIEHKDQKWTDKEGKYTGTPGALYSTQLGVVAHSDGQCFFFFSSLVAIGYFQRKWSPSQSNSITNTSRQ